jgi:hypothetical protein
MPILNRNTAKNLAKEKWGVSAFAKKRQYHGAPFGVGIIRIININSKNVLCDEYYGNGFSWEEAFEDAKNKGH